MRILQIATVITPENAYGGPTSVALAQCRALAEAGHDVVFAAGARGFDKQLPSRFQDVPIKLFPAYRLLPKAGFAALASPALEAWLVRHAKDFDAVHVHLARDFITPLAAAIAQTMGVTTCLQPHGMIDPSEKLLAKPLDAVLVRRALRAAERVFYLTEQEGEQIKAVAGPSVPLESLRNGVSPMAVAPIAHDGDVVLFIGRIHERKRPLLFARAAAALAPQFPRARFVLVGPDEGEGGALQDEIARSGLGDRLVWQGAADRAGCQQALAAADIFVLTSYLDTYPMAILEALAAGLPVVLGDDSGLAPAIREGNAGQIVPSNPEGFEAGIKALLNDKELRAEQAANAARLAADEFTMVPVAQQLLRAYSGRP